MSKILCTKNNNFSAKYDRKTSSCPITSACPITKPQVYIGTGSRLYCKTVRKIYDNSVNFL